MNYQATIIAAPTSTLNVPEELIFEQSYPGAIIRIYILNSNGSNYKLEIVNTGSPVSYYFVNVQYNFNCIKSFGIKALGSNPYYAYILTPYANCGSPIVFTISPVN